MENIFRVSNVKSKGSAHVLLGEGRGKKFGDVIAEKKVTLIRLMSSNMVKHEKFDHIHLFYHFTVRLTAK